MLPGGLPPLPPSFSLAPGLLVPSGFNSTSTAIDLTSALGQPKLPPPPPAFNWTPARVQKFMQALCNNAHWDEIQRKMKGGGEIAQFDLLWHQVLNKEGTWELNVASKVMMNDKIYYKGGYVLMEQVRECHMVMAACVSQCVCVSSLPVWQRKVLRGLTEKCGDKGDDTGTGQSTQSLRAQARLQQLGVLELCRQYFSEAKVRGRGAAQRVLVPLEAGGGDDRPPSPSEGVPPTLSYPIQSHPIPSGPVPSCPIPYHPILSRPVLSYPIPSHPAPFHPIPSHPVPSRPIPSHPVQPQPGMARAEARAEAARRRVRAAMAAMAPAAATAMLPHQGGIRSIATEESGRGAARRARATRRAQTRPRAQARLTHSPLYHPLPTPYSPLPTPRSPLPTPRSPLPAPRSPHHAPRTARHRRLRCLLSTPPAPRP